MKANKISADRLLARPRPHIPAQVPQRPLDPEAWLLQG